jgi:hypothetical protein
MELKLMTKAELEKLPLSELRLLLAEHMTAQFGYDSEWMADLKFHGSQLLNCQSVDDESDLTLTDLLKALYAKRNR